MRSAFASAFVIVAAGIATSLPQKPAPTVWSQSAFTDATTIEPQAAVWQPPVEAPGSGWRATFADGQSIHLSPCPNCQPQPSWVHMLRDKEGRLLNSSISLSLMGDEWRIYTGTHAPRPRSAGMWHIHISQFNPNGANILANDGFLGSVILAPE